MRESAFTVSLTGTHTDEEVRQRLDEAKARGISLHVWDRKEIENYLIHPLAIKRVLESEGGLRLSASTVRQAILEIADSLKDSTLDALANEWFNRDKSQGVASANRCAREIVDQAWQTVEGKVCLVSGKAVLSRLSEWSKSQYGVSFSSKRVARELALGEVPPELVKVLGNIDRNEEF